MVDEVFIDDPSTQRHPQSASDQRLITLGAHGKAYHQTGIGVEQGGQIQIPRIGPDAQNITHPFLIGHRRAEIALQQVGCHRSTMLTICGAYPATDSPERVNACLAHQSGHALAGTHDALLLQRRVNAWAAIETATVRMNRSNMIQQLYIPQLVGTGGSLAPGIVATNRNPQRSAHRFHRTQPA